ncbi:MAG: SCP2 sterol-binding domain-containing protein [Huintestinicola sp.]|uniref:SCP2 sterol-binding domain-containing protein n=1 Tax=Huintestinicola sp. TaxID=2981661 RepID=UPI003F019FB6
MTYEEIFEKSKEHILSQAPEGLEGHLAVQVNIIGEGQGAFYIELLNGKVYVEPYEYYDRDCIFIITAEDFLAICEGTLDPVAAFTKGKLKIDGSIDKALEFSRIVENAKKNAKKPEPEAPAKSEPKTPAKSEAKTAPKSRKK